MTRRLLIALLFAVSCEASQPHPTEDATVIHQDAGATAPCDPVGTWRIHYKETRGQSTLETTDRVRVQMGKSGLQISFPDQTVRPNQCSMQDGPGILAVEGTVSDDGCTVFAQRRESWCMSGEEQCEELSVTLTIAPDGKAATGSGTWCACWNPGVSCEDHATDVAATRE
jgi:hypothetical protein